MVESLRIYNIDENKIIEMNMQDDAEYLIYEGSIDWGNVQVTHNTFQYPTQFGSIVTSTVVGSRDISISGYIVEETKEKIEDKKVLLSSIINPMQELSVIVDKWHINGKPSSNVTFGSSYKENNSVLCKFLIQILCANPMFVLNDDNKIAIAEVEKLFHFPLILEPKGIIFGLRKSSLFTDVQNNGAVETGMIIRIKAKGNVNNLEILNVNTKDMIKINKVLKNGEEIIINTNKGERSILGHINNEPLESYFDYFDFDSTWLQLQVGTSTFTFRSRTSDGKLDETYKQVDIELSFKEMLYNLRGE